MNLSHIRLVVKREYTTRVRSPGFIIGTILGVVGIVALAFVPSLLSLLDQASTLKVAVVDPKNIVFPYLPVTPNTPQPTPTPAPGGELSQATLALNTGVRFSRADTTDTAALDREAKSGKLDGYIVVVGTRAGDAKLTYYANSRPSQSVSSQLLGLLGGALVQARLKENNITPQQAAEIFATPTMKVQPILTGSFKDEKVVAQSAVLVYALLILLYMTILMYGIQVAMGVVEEKSSRIIEILMASIKPIDLMIGKVLGVGLVGLTQYVAWVGSGLLVFVVLGLLSGSSVGAQLASGIDLSAVPVLTLIFFLVFFVLGYLLYATLYAALGSLVSRTEEVNSITTPLTLISVATYLLAIWGLSSPEAEMIKLLSFIPFFTPMIMFIRVALASPGWWEVGLSVVLLIATCLFFAWVAAKIYRVGLLLYGKRPSFREVARLLRA